MDPRYVLVLCPVLLGCKNSNHDWVLEHLLAHFQMDWVRKWFDLSAGSESDIPCVLGLQHFGLTRFGLWPEPWCTNWAFSTVILHKHHVFWRFFLLICSPLASCSLCFLHTLQKALLVFFHPHISDQWVKQIFEDVVSPRCSLANFFFFVLRSELWDCTMLLSIWSKTRDFRNRMASCYLPLEQIFSQEHQQHFKPRSLYQTISCDHVTHRVISNYQIRNIWACCLIFISLDLNMGLIVRGWSPFWSSGTSSWCVDYLSVPAWVSQQDLAIKPQIYISVFSLMSDVSPHWFWRTSANLIKEKHLQLIVVVFFFITRLKAN